MEAVNVLQKLNPHSRILSEQDNIAFQRTLFLGKNNAFTRVVCQTLKSVDIYFPTCWPDWSMMVMINRWFIGTLTFFTKSCALLLWFSNTLFYTVHVLISRLHVELPLYAKYRIYYRYCMYTHKWGFLSTSISSASSQAVQAYFVSCDSNFHSPAPADYLNKMDMRQNTWSHPCNLLDLTVRSYQKAVFYSVGLYFGVTIFHWDAWILVPLFRTVFC